MYGTKVILTFVSLSGILGFLTPTSFAHIHGYLGPFRTSTKPPTTLQAKVRSVAGAGETCLDYGNCKPGQAPSTSSNEQQNMFDSQDECEQICPNTYPPVIEIEKKVSYYPGNIQHFISWASYI